MTETKDTYLTIAREARSESRVKGSRFIGETFRISSAEYAAAKLEAVRQREFSATHHCHAWQIGFGDRKQFRYSDDGEPTGTAGRPIYEVITGHSVTNLLLVVTRYFGGIKLGSGGLARAYSDAARTVLELSGVVESFVTTRYRFTLVIPLYQRWMKLLNRLGAQVVDSRFSADAATDVEIRLTRADELLASFAELTSGRGRCERIDDS